MIETLCIVAEITAALLLLSLARPSSKSNDDRNLKELLSETHVALEQGEKAIQTLQFLSILTAVRSPDPQKQEGDEEGNHSLSQKLGELFSSIHPLLPSMSADSLTLLPERKAIESLVEIAGDWQAWLDQPIQIAIIQPDGMGDLDHHHGPVVCEKMIRATAEFLKGEIGGRGLISRFGFQAFAIALLGYTRNDATKLIEEIRVKATEATWLIDEIELHSTFSASLVEVTNFENAEVWETPEDGLATAISQGGNRGYWRDFSDESWKPMGEYQDAPTSVEESVEDEVRSTVSNVESEPNLEEASPSKNVTSVAPPTSDSVQPKPAMPNATGSPAESNESGATSDDIAALFQAAKKAKTAPPAEVPQAEASPEPLEEQSVSADDIATLFQSAKNQAVEEPKTAEEDPASANSDLNAKATSDDIADLFATVRSAVKPAVASPETTKTNTNAALGVDYDKPALKSPEELGVAASEDDIAALFKAFKK